MTKRAKIELVSAIVLSFIAALSWWRASQGLPGWTEMSVLWSAGTIISWVYFLRYRKAQRT